MWRICLALLLVASRAEAQPHFDPKDPELYRSVGDGMAIAIASPGAVYVVKGKQHIRIAGADHFESVNVDKQARKVTAVIADYTCLGKTRYEWTFGHLAARLENARAFALHKKQDWKGAAAGFARATALDPTWKTAAYNLASAHQLSGDKAAAMVALAPFLAADPLGTSLDVARDPELAPLLDQPALVALRAPKPGTARLSTTGLDGTVLVAPDRGLVAIARVESSWGSSAFTVELQIWDPGAQKLVASTAAVEWNDTSPETGTLKASAKAQVTDRMARLSAQLAALGFRPAAKLEKGVDNSDGTKAKFNFAKAKLGVVGPSDMANTAFVDGTVNILRKNTTLATAKITGRLRGAWLADDSVVVIEMQRHSAEGCDGGPELALTVARLQEPGRGSSTSTTTP